MPVEVEAKMKVAGLAAIRARLLATGATRVGARLELNAFFDTPDNVLKAKDEGLRLRTMTDDRGGITCVATFKGPHVGGDGDDTLKRREELEFAVGDFDAASAMFARLGYRPTLAFEKRRETWSIGDCLVELDELPHLGTFVEIEGDADRIHAVRATLGLADAPLITRGYIGMISRLARDDPSVGSVVRFGR